MVLCILCLVIEDFIIISGLKVLLYSKLNSIIFRKVFKELYFFILVIVVNYFKFKMLVFFVEFNVWLSYLVENVVLICCFYLGVSCVGCRVI